MWVGFRDASRECFERQSSRVREGAAMRLFLLALRRTISVLKRISNNGKMLRLPSSSGTKALYHDCSPEREE